jgi:SET domain-containing protein
MTTPILSPKTLKTKKTETTIPVRYKVKRSFSGLGLFATENIKKGEVIIEYIGNIIDDAEAEKKHKTMYIFEVKKNTNIDGSPRWNTARYANYSCDPNAESENKKSRIFLIAIKNIKQGDEITFDYGEEFVEEHIKPYGCRCGSKKCKMKK